MAAAVAALAPDAGGFYERVRAWRAVPPALQRLPPLAGDGGERMLVDRRKLERWLATEVGRCLAANPGQASAAEAAAVDAELGEYVAGLLEHADYCDTTLLRVELVEFLGDQAAVRWARDSGRGRCLTLGFVALALRRSSCWRCGSSSSSRSVSCSCLYVPKASLLPLRH